MTVLLLLMMIMMMMTWFFFDRICDFLTAHLWSIYYWTPPKEVIAVFTDSLLLFFKRQKRFHGYALYKIKRKKLHWQQFYVRFRCYLMPLTVVKWRDSAHFFFFCHRHRRSILASLSLNFPSSFVFHIFPSINFRSGFMTLVPPSLVQGNGKKK